MWKNAWFNKETTRVGELTARSTRQPTLKKNNEEGNQKIISIAKKWKEKTHTQKKKLEDIQQIKCRKKTSQTSSGTSNELTRNKDGFAYFEW